MKIEPNKENPDELDLKGLTKGKLIVLYHLLSEEEENNPRMSILAKEILGFLKTEKQKFL